MTSLFFFDSAAKARATLANFQLYIFSMQAAASPELFAVTCARIEKISHAVADNCRKYEKAFDKNNNEKIAFYAGKLENLCEKIGKESEKFRQGLENEKKNIRLVACRDFLRLVNTGNAERIALGNIPTFESVEKLTENELFRAFWAPEKNKADMPLQHGNLKLPSSVLIFSLLAGTTCLFVCQGCYAISAQVCRPSAYDLRLKNTWLAIHKPEVLQENIEKQIYEEIRKSFTSGLVYNEEGNLCFRRPLPSACRIHESGELFSAHYAGIWAKVCRKYGHILPFYAYTKNMQIAEPLSCIPGFFIVSSFLPSGLVNFALSEKIKRQAEKENVYLCPCNEKNTEKMCHISCFHCSGGCGIDGKLHHNSNAIRKICGISCGIIYTAFEIHGDGKKKAEKAEKEKAKKEGK